MIKRVDPAAAGVSDGGRRGATARARNRFNPPATVRFSPLATAVRLLFSGRVIAIDVIIARRTRFVVIIVRVVARSRGRAREPSVRPADVWANGRAHVNSRLSINNHCSRSHVLKRYNTIGRGMSDSSRV